MIRIEGNELRLDDKTFYNLSKTSIIGIVQRLNYQLHEGALTNNDYDQCLSLLEAYEKKEVAPEVPVQEQTKKIIISIDNKVIATQQTHD